MKKRNSLLGAKRKGYDAYILGETTCPYKDKRKDDGKLTWSRAYITAWCDGYHQAAYYFGDLYEAIPQTCSIKYK